MADEKTSTTETKTDFFGQPEKDSVGENKTETTTDEGEKTTTETKTDFFGQPEKDPAGENKKETKPS